MRDKLTSMFPSVNILTFTSSLRFHPDAKSMARDEEYEKGVVKGNMVYKIHWTEPPTLMPVESMCGHIPQVSIFDTKEVSRLDIYWKAFTKDL